MKYSVVEKNSLDSIVLRLDAEYYHPECLFLDNKIQSLNGITLRKDGAILDCSAFYPSITEYYSNEKSNIPFLRVNEIQNGLVSITDNTVFLPERIITEYKNNIAVAYPGDIVIAKGGNTLGKVGLLTNDFNKYSVSTEVTSFLSLK